jgi:hypothetical protein
MNRLTFVLLISLPVMAAVNGTVVNRTTDKPQAGATVALFKLGQQNGLEQVDQAKSDTQGKFNINQEVQGPYLLRTAFDGVTYNHMLPPGSPVTGITLEVYNSAAQPGAAKVGKHMLMFQPGGGQMTVNETYLYTNDGKAAWNDPDNGTLHFYLPSGASGKAQVNATAPGGMPIPAAVNKTSKPGIYSVDFPVKPGETRFDVTYGLPYTEGAPYEGKIATKDENSYLIVPDGVTISGDGLNDLGQEPRSKAHIFGFIGTAYKIKLTGTAAPSAPATTSADADASGGQQDGGPQIEQIMPRLYGKVKLILGLALGILALGFALLYRASAPPAKEANERARR